MSKDKKKFTINILTNIILNSIALFIGICGIVIVLIFKNFLVPWIIFVDLAIVVISIVLIVLAACNLIALILAIIGYKKKLRNISQITIDSKEEIFQIIETIGIAAILLILLIIIVLIL